MGGEVPDLQTVSELDFLEAVVDALNGEHASFFAEETGLVDVGDLQRLIAVLYMLLKTIVDFNYPSLARFLLGDHEGVLTEQHVPCECAEIGNAESEETSAADKEAKTVITVVEEFSDQGKHGIPFEVIGSRVAIPGAHSLSTI